MALKKVFKRSSDLHLQLKGVGKDPQRMSKTLGTEDYVVPFNWLCTVPPT